MHLVKVHSIILNLFIDMADWLLLLEALMKQQAYRRKMEYLSFEGFIFHSTLLRYI